ncbi:MAG: outer membrane protein assembly factor BamE [Sutterellaceae bacterium]|nr:outer membrane protein assembly factor BamE [Sutterellaceae bacterium]
MNKLLIALFSTLVLAGCGINLDTAAQVRPGWTMEQVKDLLGKPEYRKVKGQYIIWEYVSYDALGWPNGNATFVFQDGKVVDNTEPLDVRIQK